MSRSLFSRGVILLPPSVLAADCVSVDDSTYHLACSGKMLIQLVVTVVPKDGGKAMIAAAAAGGGAAASAVAPPKPAEPKSECAVRATW